MGFSLEYSKVHIVPGLPWRFSIENVERKGTKGHLAFIFQATAPETILSQHHANAEQLILSYLRNPAEMEQHRSN